MCADEGGQGAELAASDHLGRTIPFVTPAAALPTLPRVGNVANGALRRGSPSFCRYGWCVTPERRHSGGMMSGVNSTSSSPGGQSGAANRCSFDHCHSRSFRAVRRSVKQHSASVTDESHVERSTLPYADGPDHAVLADCLSSSRDFPPTREGFSQCLFGTR